MDIQKVKHKFREELEGIQLTKRRRYSTPLKAAIIELNERGISRGVLREAFGISLCALMKWTRKEKVIRPPKDSTNRFQPLRVIEGSQRDVSLVVDLPLGVRLRFVSETGADKFPGRILLS